MNLKFAFSWLIEFEHLKIYISFAFAALFKQLQRLISFGCSLPESKEASLKNKKGVVGKNYTGVEKKGAYTEKSVAYYGSPHFHQQNSFSHVIEIT